MVAMNCGDPIIDGLLAEEASIPNLTAGANCRAVGHLQDLLRGHGYNLLARSAHILVWQVRTLDVPRRGRLPPEERPGRRRLGGFGPAQRSCSAPRAQRCAESRIRASGDERGLHPDHPVRMADLLVRNRRRIRHAQSQHRPVRRLLRNSAMVAEAGSAAQTTSRLPDTRARGVGLDVIAAGIPRSSITPRNRTAA